MEEVFFHNGDWHERQPMLIGPMNHAFWMASVVFDGARSIRGLVPDVEDHCARLVSSATNMLLAPKIEPGEIAELCREGVRKLPRDMELYIRPMFYAREGFLVPDADSTDFVLAIYNNPLPPEGPFSVCMSSRRRPARDMAPTTAKASCLYPNTALALVDCAKRGFDNAVILDPNGNVAEFLSSNLWMVKDGVAFTPAINGTFLNGVTRQRTIQLLKDDGIEVVEGTLTVDDLRNADELFSSGNHAKIRPVSRFEDREFQPGPIGRRAKELYLEYANGFDVF